ncbi:MAG: MFS transporter [Chloroflexota bacterium]
MSENEAVRDPDAAAQRIIERHANRNFILNVLDGSTFYLGISMVSRYTVLPLLVERLSGERWMQGLIPTIYYSGWLLPSLVVAPLLASRPRRLPFLLTVTIFERLPYLFLGLLLLLAPDAPPSVLLAAFLVLFTVNSFGGGASGVPWQDYISRVIPGRRWGVFFGLQAGLGGALGVGGAALATMVLDQQPFPQSIGILSLACFACMVVAYIFLALTVEPAMRPQPAQSVGMFVRSIVPLLRRDVAFRRYLISRAAIALGMVGHSFVTAAALERFSLPNEQVGLFTAALLASQAVSNLGLGVLADRWGHKQVLELSTALGMLAVLLAAVAPAAWWFVLIFVLVGAAQAGYMLTGFTLVFGFSKPADRPMYIGVANLAIAPVAVFGPLLAGALAEAAGYVALFVALAALGLFGLGSLHWRVPTPARGAGDPAAG